MRKTARGTSSSQPITAPLNRTAATRGPTMYPTPISAGEADGVATSNPPVYSIRSPRTSICERPN